MKIVYEKKIKSDDIVITPRPVWKCKTCSFYNKRPSCPPFTPSWRDAKEWVEHYFFALLIKFAVDMKNFEAEKREVINWLLRKESELFEQYPFVFALFPGACNLCVDCDFEKTGVCTFPNKVRPSLDALGIEISKLVKLDYSEEVLYSVILLD